MKLQVIILCTGHRNIVQGDRSERCLPTASSDFGPCPSNRLFSVIWQLEVCFCPWTLVIQVHAPKTSSISQGELHVALKCLSLRHNARWNVFLLTENDFKNLLIQSFLDFFLHLFLSWNTDSFAVYFIYTPGCLKGWWLLIPKFMNTKTSNLDTTLFFFGTILRGKVCFCI